MVYRLYVNIISYGDMLLLFSCMLTIVHDQHIIVCIHGSQTHAS